MSLHRSLTRPSLAPTTKATGVVATPVAGRQIPRLGRRLGTARSGAVAGVVRALQRWYPLTLLGSAFATGSPHEFLLSIAGFLALLGWRGSAGCRRTASSWWSSWDSSAPLAAREHGAQHRLRTRAARSWLFYRIHLRVVWRLQAGRRAVLRG